MEPLTSESHCRTSQSSWTHTISGAMHHAGQMLKVTGVADSVRNILERTYGYLTGNPHDPTGVPDKPLLARKLHKLTLQDRPYKARSGYTVLDHLGLVESPATLLYHSQGPLIQHNGKFSRQCGNESEPIRCRHLAYGYVSGAFGRSPEKFQAVETEERLLNTSGIPDEKTLTKNFHDHLPGHAVYFSLQTLPDALYFLAQEIEDHQRVNYLLCSTNHAMGLSLEKTKGQGITLYCYDPNDTGRHKKIIVHDADELKKLTIDDLVANTHRYFPQGLESGCLLSIEVKKKQEDCRVKCFGPQDVGTVCLMAEYGHYGATDLDGKPMRLADTKQNAQLIGKLTDGAPALFMAAQYGHTETVRALAEMILSSSLDNETKNELLAGKTSGWHVCITVWQPNMGTLRPFGFWQR